jgi:oxygen-independent coproporphyrinogen-3 oxidase
LSRQLLEIIDPTSTLSLYIHVPFCNTKCSYCHFYSIETKNNNDYLKELYFNKLIKELELVVNKRESPFETLFIGGGDPFLLKIEYLEKILDLASRNGKIKEITIESNPTSLNENYKRLIEKGLTRLSIGLQSLNENHLNTLGRNVTVKENLRLLNLIKDETNIDFNLDLITSIPNQNLKDTTNDIDIIVDTVKPSHISLYNLTVEENTLLANRVKSGTVTILDEDEQADLLLAIWDYLDQKGYHQYEISNFSLSKEKRSFHNELTWNWQNYLGLGAAAVSTLTFKNQTYRINAANSVNDYINYETFSIYSIENLDFLSLVEESLILSLRTEEGIDKKRWNKRFNLDFDQLFDPILQPLIKNSKYLFKETKEHLALSKEGLLISDALLVKLISSLATLLDR